MSLRCIICTKSCAYPPASPLPDWLSIPAGLLGAFLLIWLTE